MVQICPWAIYWYVNSRHKYSMLKFQVGNKICIIHTDILKLHYAILNSVAGF